ncbi:MAG: ATP-binding protein [Candidatus Melainabacteria bacterium]|nr:ATP-binding protein [Candidatus Melainabacteria bacterium]
MTFEPPKNDPHAETLLMIRQEIERQTQAYIELLLESRQAVENHASFLSTILECIGDNLIVYDAEGKVMLANKAAIQFAGLDFIGSDRNKIRERVTFLTDKNGTEIPREDEPYTVAMEERRVSEREGYLHDAKNPDNGGWIRAQASPVVDKHNNFLGVVATASDISERKHLQKQRDGLASLIAHDVKNHLISEEYIIGDLLEKPNLPPEIRSDLQTVYNSAKHHRELANAMLQIHHTDFMLDAHSSVSIDLNSVLQMVLELNALEAQSKSVIIKTDVEDDLPSIKGVAAGLRHVLHNLLHNAIKASNNGGTVTLKIENLPSVCKVKITIHNGGKIIAAADLDRLFDQHTVASRIPRYDGSTGFGLYLSKIMLDAHKATVKCTSNQESGTMFEIELPTG